MLNCSDEAQYLSLDSLSCSTICPSGTVAGLIDAHPWQDSTLKYCRDLTQIYVNSLSTSFIEIGTKEYPYKRLHSAFIEIWNYLSVGEEITIYVMEDSEYVSNFYDIPYVILD